MKNLLTIALLTISLSGCLATTSGYKPSGGKADKLERNTRIDLYKNCIKRTGDSKHCAWLFL